MGLLSGKFRWGGAFLVTETESVKFTGPELRYVISSVRKFDESLKAPADLSSTRQKGNGAAKGSHQIRQARPE